MKPLADRDATAVMAVRPRPAGLAAHGRPGLLATFRGFAARGRALSVMACLVAVHCLAASSEAFELANFNDDAELPSGFATTLDVAPAVREALLHQAIGSGYTGAETVRLSEPESTSAAFVPLIAVRLTLSNGLPVTFAGTH